MPDPVTSFILGQLAEKLFGDAYVNVKEEIGGLLAEDPVKRSVGKAHAAAVGAFRRSLEGSLDLTGGGFSRVDVLLIDAAYLEAIGCLLMQAEPDRDRCYEAYARMVPEGGKGTFDSAWIALSESIEQSIAAGDELDRLAKRAAARRREAHEKSVERTLGAIDDKLNVIVRADARAPENASLVDPAPTPAADSGQVFISYRHVPLDTELAEALDDHLRSLGVPVFLDQRIEIG